MSKVCYSAPAKLNLFLAVTGRRVDGFHDLVSVAAPLDWGDELAATCTEQGAGERFSLKCGDPSVPVDGSNLVLKAAAAFAGATGWKGGAQFQLTKAIPVGAGLGGGSSDAVATLRVLNDLSGGRLGDAALRDLAATLGADCPLFLAGGPVVMRGRGEQLEALAAGELARLRGRRVLIFKPGFGVSTPWAYGRMAARPETYVPAAEAEARLAAWRAGAAPAEDLLFNAMESVVFAKFPALPALHTELHERFGLQPRMSGSGSASFAFLDEKTAPGPVVDCIRAAWGPTAFVLTARLA
ncbi:MAG: 4-(cytidine 5'-diphospho)-2-C-methyl-D-erythritol kinase [Cephaloticoccus sp.]